MSPARRPKRELKRPPLDITPEELREWREKHNLSQAELAYLLGVTQAAVSAWELKKRKIPPFLKMTLLFLEKEGFLP